MATCRAIGSTVPSRAAMLSSTKSSCHSHPQPLPGPAGSDPSRASQNLAGEHSQISRSWCAIQKQVNTDVSTNSGNRNKTPPAQSSCKPLQTALQRNAFSFLKAGNDNQHSMVQGIKWRYCFRRAGSSLAHSQAASTPLDLLPNTTCNQSQLHLSGQVVPRSPPFHEVLFILLPNKDKPGLFHHSTQPLQQGGGTQEDSQDTGSGSSHPSQHLSREKGEAC